MVVVGCLSTSVVLGCTNLLVGVGSTLGAFHYVRSALSM